MKTEILTEDNKSSYWQNASKLAVTDATEWWLDCWRKLDYYITSGNKFRHSVINIHDIHLVSVHAGQATISSFSH